MGSTPDSIPIVTISDPPGNNAGIASQPNNLINTYAQVVSQSSSKTSSTSKTQRSQKKVTLVNFKSRY